MKKILVTGGAGFIGTNLCKKLLKEEHEVIVYDNLSRSPLKYIPNNNILFKGDVRDENRLKQAMKGIDIVVHLAAYGSVVESVSDPDTNFDINVKGTYTVLNTARQSNIEKVIFASTGGALIGDAKPPVNENSLPKPISPYGSSKLCGEAYCHSFSRSYGINTVSLRFANVFGPYSAHKKGAVTKFIKCILQDEPIPIFGDGTASRDYLHVFDLCDGIMKAMFSDTQPGSVYHLASQREVTVKELAQSLIKTSGKDDHPINFYDKRPGEVARNFANSEKASHELGFTPHFDLKTGLKDTWDWFLNHKREIFDVQESDS